jgi:hypothetical protein
MTAPMTLYPPDRTESFDPGGELPIIDIAGTLVSDQDTLNAILAAAAAQGIFLYSSPWSGGNGSRTAIPYVKSITVNDIEHVPDEHGNVDLGSLDVGGGGGTGGGPVTSDDITDATSTGKAVLTATSAAAARTAIGAGTSSFDGTYSALSGKPTIPTTAADVGAVPTTRTVNGKPLSGDVVLSSADVSAVPVSRTVNGKPLNADVTLAAADVGAAPYALASGASAIRFVGSGSTLPGTGTAGDVFFKSS